MEAVYEVDVKRKKIDDDVDVWYATLANGLKYEAASETLLREKVRVCLLADAASKMSKHVDELSARLKRTWHVRIVEGISVPDDVVWDLFA
jgi:hypothetical protein